MCQLPQIKFNNHKQAIISIALIVVNKSNNMKDPVNQKKGESIEHLVTVLSIWIEDGMSELAYRKACEYVESWVEYRLPKSLKDKIK